MKRFLDLFSGLGGASEAFVRSPSWEVLRIENNPLLADVPESVQMDILSDVAMLTALSFQPDFIWASPPCLEFSQAFSAPKPKAKREGREFKPSLDLVRRAKEIIETVEPKYWVIENVIGAIKDFEPVLGRPRLICGSFVFWGNFPLFTPPLEAKKHTKKGIDVRDSPIRANIRAKIPLVVSQSFLKTVECQQTLPV